VPAELQADPVVAKTLKLLEERGDTLKDFTADLRYSVVHARAGTTETNTGTAAFVKDAAGTVRVAIQLDKLIVDGAIADEGLNHQIVFNGAWITEKDPPKKIYRRVQVTPEGAAKQDPFALRGPLPLPIGQKVGKVLEEFTVTPMKAPAKSPTGAVALKLVPKKEGVYDFSELKVVVDPSEKVQLPIRLARTGTDGNVTNIELFNPKINTGEAGKLNIFDVSEPKEAGWSKEIRPLEEKGGKKSEG
jgi:hypothetical protein